MSRAARLGSWLLFAVGVVLLVYAAYVLIDERLYQTRERKRLGRERQVAAVAGTGGRPGMQMPRADPPTDGVSIGEIRIARLGLSAVVVQGESDGILRRAVGHLARTALPGNEGNIVLAGHRDTLFRPLKDIVRGDRITLQTPLHDFEYVVESTSIVNAADVDVIEPSGGHTLTLITCFPFYYVGPAPKRLIVLARESN